MARIDTDEHQRLISASIGLAQPKDTSKWGDISEVHEHGLSLKDSGDMAEDLEASMLGTTLGIELNPNVAWIERENAYKSSGLIVKVTNITQSVTSQKGFWTTAIAMAAFIL